MASDYPGALDPAPPELVGGVDVLTADVLDHAVRMLRAVEVALGLMPADMTVLDGGKDLGTVADAIFQLNRVETGKHGPVTIASEEEFDVVQVNFSDSKRFTVPPMVKLQTHQPYDATTNLTERLEPRNVTTSGFQIAVLREVDTFGNPVPSPFGGHPFSSFTLTFTWLAIQPPFGFVED